MPMPMPKPSLSADEGAGRPADPPDVVRLASSDARRYSAETLGLGTLDCVAGVILVVPSPELVTAIAGAGVPLDETSRPVMSELVVCADERDDGRTDG